MSKQTEADYRSSPLYNFALRTKLWRHFKTARGVWRTYLRGNHAAYDEASYWQDWYADQINDSATIEPGKSAIATRVHYNATENAILSACDRAGVSLDGAHVLDIGSGAGHWIDFYRGMGAARIVGVELAQRAASALVDRYTDDDTIAIVQGNADTIDYRDEYDIINAIGVMFHIVDDSAFHLSVDALKRAARPGGCLIIGGQFGWFDGLNVQFDRNGRATKRLRSYRHWRRLLRGWRTTLIQNRAYRLVNATLPEANIMLARKPG